MFTSKVDGFRLYKENIDVLRWQAKLKGINDVDLNTVFQNGFLILKENNDFKEKPYFKSTFKKFFKFTVTPVFVMIATMLILYILLNVHQPTSSVVLRNVQGFIYPGLKMLRFLSVPILRLFTSLTNLYDETCLVENPYFFVSDMECWPCESVYSVVNLTGFANYSLYQSGIPYIIQTDQKRVTFSDIHKVYKANKRVFDTDSYTVKSTNTSIRSLHDLFNFSPTATKSSKSHFLWRINRMQSARIIRKLFPRPCMISHRSGQGMERFIIIDEPFADAYSLPNPECSYVLITQGSGERTIILKPSKECIYNCKSVSVVLKPSTVLWYNWWYWRPISLPVENSTDVSITYMSNYC